MGQQPFRVTPALDVTQVQTFAIATPIATHTREASCAEVDCEHYLNGWRTTVDEGTDLGQQQAYYIRNVSGRHYREDRNQAPGLTVFEFEAGQTCFTAEPHRIQTRPELFVVRDGDWRGNPTGRRRIHQRPEDWVDEFANHQLAVRELRERG